MPSALIRPKPMPRKKRPEPFHAKLKRLVESRRGERSVAEIARQAGMKPQALHQILNGGTADIQLGTLTAILAAIDSNLREFEDA